MSKDIHENYTHWIALTRAHYYMYKIREKELKKLKLTITQSTVLDIIVEFLENNIEATPMAISKRLLRAASTTTGIVNRMEAKGLVKRVQDLYRKNMVRTEMTGLGKELYEKSIGVQYLSPIYSQLTSRSRNSLTKSLDVLSEAARKRKV